jgi:hypothetical protein
MLDTPNAESAAPSLTPAGIRWADLEESELDPANYVWSIADDACGRIDISASMRPSEPAEAESYLPIDESAGNDDTWKDPRTDVWQARKKSTCVGRAVTPGSFRTPVSSVPLTGDKVKSRL